jgi:hypothetical protein
MAVEKTTGGGVREQSHGRISPGSVISVSSDEVLQYETVKKVGESSGSGMKEEQPEDVKDQLSQEVHTRLVCFGASTIRS